MQLHLFLQDSPECVQQHLRTVELLWLLRTTVKRVHLQFHTTEEPSWVFQLVDLVCSVFLSLHIGLTQVMLTQTLQPQQDSVWVLHPLPSSLVLVAVFTPRLPTLVQTLSVRSKQVFLRMILVTPVLSLITSETTLGTSLEWVLTSSNPLSVQLLLL